MTDWIAAFPKSKRPRVGDIEAYLEPAAGARFRSLMERLAPLGLRYVAPEYTRGTGWRLAVGKSGLLLIDGIRFAAGHFCVDGVAVEDDDALERILADIEARCRGEFAARFAAFAAQRGRRQQERAARRRAREAAERQRLLADVGADRLNRFAWSPRVSRRALQRLYESDARGLADAEGVAEVGYALYARCLQARDAWALIEAGRLKCHGCGQLLGPAPDPLRCPCGRVYQFREYMRSFRAANMPRGAAAAVFDGFVESWPRAAGYAARMRLVDDPVHAFHANLLSGVRGRPVAVNLVQGTVAQIRDLVEGLARR